jgi:hypothetical protein
MTNAVDRLIAGAVAAERERCAKVVEDSEKEPYAHKRHPRPRAMLKKIAEAIRKGPDVPV